RQKASQLQRRLAMLRAISKATDVPVPAAATGWGNRSEAFAGMNLVALRNWHDAFLDMYEDFPDFMPSQLRPGHQFKVTGVFEDGLITATFKDSKEEQQLYLLADMGEQESMGCTCEESLGEGGCSHLRMFLQNTID